MDEIAIRDPCPGDADELEALITEHFSEGSSYGVDLGISDPTHHVLVAVEVEADADAGDGGDSDVGDRAGADAGGVTGGDDPILGVMALREFEDPSAVADEMHFFDDPDLIPAAERYGHLEMGYVRDEATGRGIGSRLLERLHAIGAERGVDLFLADSWYHGGADSPEKLFDRHGYETVHREPIDRPAAECPKCEVECTCEAAIAVRRVEEGPQ
ncbi:GNAT family N-acetyltransferase [Halorubrum sp. Boch-26]|uniref:GNAT family N-acetyltransferase n=1 Tax=Halorubrum sp. Boch-26 TaxID=2994426 RepID=UPI002468E71A|nr:GNAT family N-acetyltransferase [Halorubrum sp. Boch-26]